MDKRNNIEPEPAEHVIIKMDKPLPLIIKKRVIVSEIPIEDVRQPIGEGQYLRRAPVRAWREDK